MVTLFFDIEEGELWVSDKNEKLRFQFIRTSDGNYQSVLTAYAQERLIKKLVASMTLKEEV